MRLLLTTLNAKYIHTNLAIRILYQLNKAHPGLAWKEFSIKENLHAIALHCSQYDVVAFSCYIWNITQTLQVAAQIKSLNAACKILLGGPEVSYEWQEIINHPAIDYIITGEGEIPFQKFLQHYPNVAVVPSLVQKKNGGVYYNALQEVFEVQQLAHINPYADDDPSTLPQRVLYIETSRGCPYKCEFCLASLDNKVRYLPIATIKQNLLFLMQHGKVIKFLDRTFNIKKDFTLDVFAYILQHHRPGNVFQFEITADIIHPEIITYIQQHVPKGLLRFEIGIQTVNQKANLAVSRKQNFDKTASVIRQLQGYIDLHLDLIVGLPHDEYEDIRHSIEQVFLLFPKELQLGFLKFLKGTPVREKYEEHDFVFDTQPPYQIISSRYLSAQQLHCITQAEHALELFWNKGKAIRTLTYAALRYHIFDFLTGLGKVLEERDLLHSYTQRSVYEALEAYIKNTFPQDSILLQLLAIDFAMSYKVKPPALFYPEQKIEDPELIKELQSKNLRFVAFTISLDLYALMNKKELLPTEQSVLLTYNGTQWPQCHSLSTYKTTV